MTDPHHDTAKDHKWVQSRIHILLLQEGCDDHIPARHHLPVRLHDDPVTKIDLTVGSDGLRQDRFPTAVPYASDSFSEQHLSLRHIH